MRARIFPKKIFRGNTLNPRFQEGVTPPVPTPEQPKVAIQTWNQNSAQAPDWIALLSFDTGHHQILVLSSWSSAKMYDLFRNFVFACTCKACYFCLRLGDCRLEFSASCDTKTAFWSPTSRYISNNSGSFVSIAFTVIYWDPGFSTTEGAEKLRRLPRKNLLRRLGGAVVLDKWTLDNGLFIDLSQMNPPKHFVKLSSAAVNLLWEPGVGWISWSISRSRWFCTRLKQTKPWNQSN